MPSSRIVRPRASFRSSPFPSSWAGASKRSRSSSIVFHASESSYSGTDDSIFSARKLQPGAGTSTYGGSTYDSGVGMLSNKLDPSTQHPTPSLVSTFDTLNCRPRRRHLSRSHHVTCLLASTLLMITHVAAQELAPSAIESDASAGKKQSDPFAGILYGTMIALLTAGALLAQAWHYVEEYGHRKADHPALQCTIGALVLLSLLQIGLLIARVIDIFVTHFGSDALSTQGIGWETSLAFILSVLMVACTQVYSCHRSYLSVSSTTRPAWNIVPGTIIIFAMVCGIVSSVLVLRAGPDIHAHGAVFRVSEGQPRQHWSAFFLAWLISICSIDISLTVVFAWSLSKLKSSFWNTRYAVARLLVLSLQTCMMTTPFSVTTLILFFASPSTLNYVITLLPIGQIYSLSLLVTLLSRRSISLGLAKDDMIGTGEAVMRRTKGAEPGMQTRDHVLQGSFLSRPLIRRAMRKEDREGQEDLAGETLPMILMSRMGDGDEEKTPRSPSKAALRQTPEPYGHTRGLFFSSQAVLTPMSISGPRAYVGSPSSGPFNFDRISYFGKTATATGKQLPAQSDDQQQQQLQQSPPPGLSQVSPAVNVLLHEKLNEDRGCVRELDEHPARSFESASGQRGHKLSFEVPTSTTGRLSQRPSLKHFGGETAQNTARRATTSSTPFENAAMSSSELYQVTPSSPQNISVLEAMHEVPHPLPTVSNSGIDSFLERTRGAADNNATTSASVRSTKHVLFSAGMKARSQPVVHRPRGDESDGKTGHAM